MENRNLKKYLGTLTGPSGTTRNVRDPNYGKNVFASKSKSFDKKSKGSKAYQAKGGKAFFKVPTNNGMRVFAPFHPTPIYSKKFRYKIGTAIIGQTITQANIFAMWVLAISSTQGRSIIANFRIKKIIAIATGLSSTSTDELFIRDANAQGIVDPIDASSTGQGNALVVWKPNKNSLCADWFNYNTGGSLVILSVPSGATIEFDMDFVLSGAAGTISGASYTATLTQGYMYSMGPDGAAGSIYYQALGMNQA